MNVALMSYHKDIYDIYKPEWIDDYRYSILNQTYKDFKIFEVNYGDRECVIFQESQYFSKKFSTFVHCMNWMMNLLFTDLKYDAVCNSNCDDIYHPEWLEKSIKKIQDGYDIVSSNFQLFDERGVYHSHHFDRLNIENELNKNHNILCHPSIVYSADFFSTGNRYIPEEIPFEDRELWKRAIKSGSKVFINEENLVFHRIHNQSVCRSNNR